MMNHWVCECGNQFSGPNICDFCEVCQTGPSGERVAHDYQPFLHATRCSYCKHTADPIGDAAAAKEAALNVIAQAREKYKLAGQSILDKMTDENIYLGISSATIDGEPATGVLFDRTQRIIGLLGTGSLLEVIRACRAVPPEHKDGTFITDARLLDVVHSCERVLNLPISQSL